jgi:threonine/homoserine/homoserine lactone efflux protein
MGGQLLAFLGVSVVVIVVPGPDTALTIRNALAGGRRGGVATAAGVATGQAVWTIATSVGIAELIQASEPAFQILKWAGAAYLITLGLQSLWTATRTSDPGRGVWTTGSPPHGVGLPSRSGAPSPGGRGSGGPRAGPVGRAWLSPGRGLRQGVVSNLANPKMAAFYLSLLPQFASAEGGAGPILALGLVFCLMTFGWLALYSVVVHRARVVLRRPRVRRALDGLSGLVLVGFGTRLALQQR